MTVATAGWLLVLLLLLPRTTEYDGSSSGGGNRHFFHPVGPIFRFGLIRRKRAGGREEHPD